MEWIIFECFVEPHQARCGYVRPAYADPLVLEWCFGPEGFDDDLFSLARMATHHMAVLMRRGADLQEAQRADDGAGCSGGIMVEVAHCLLCCLRVVCCALGAGGEDVLWQLCALAVI